MIVQNPPDGFSVCDPSVPCGFTLLRKKAEQGQNEGEPGSHGFPQNRVLDIFARPLSVLSA